MAASVVVEEKYLFFHVYHRKEGFLYRKPVPVVAKSFDEAKKMVGVGDELAEVGKGRDKRLSRESQGIR